MDFHPWPTSDRVIIDVPLANQDWGCEPHMDDSYFEEIHVGTKEQAGPYIVPKSELVSFATKWDPLPMHADEDVAKASPHGGLIAPASYTLAVTNMLLSRLDHRPASIGAAGYEDVQFLQPVRPGDQLTVVPDCMGKRESKGKRDRGVVMFKAELWNQRNQVVFTYRATVIVRRSP